ncbi:MAG: hypothetical protein HQM10_07560 [Candidatus Riflebacteria bacterium]|nr:hypothetical protein [Candidatus Riflebacteria bacterium]
MTKECLFARASTIKLPSLQAATTYDNKSEALVAKINQLMTQREDLERLIGKGNSQMMEDNHRNHARFMNSIFRHYDAGVFVDTILWVFRAYRTHGFNLSYWPAQLDTWVQIMKSELPEEIFKELYPFYEFMIVNQPAFAELSDGFVADAKIGHHS